MKVLFADSKFWKGLPADFQKKYEDEVKKSFKEASKLVPTGSEYINFLVQPSPYDLIPETHDAARTINSELIRLAFDPEYAKEHPDEILSHIKPSVYHEMNHAARFNIPIWHKSLLEWCLMEGLATVFERDRAGGKPLWGEYPDNVSEWLTEVRGAKDSERDQIMFRHSDGRRWIGYKVGTYMIDEAIKKSGKTIEELTALECDEIFKLAGI